MIDHMALNVTDYERSKGFYLRALEPLGYALVMELSRDRIPELGVPKLCGIGVDGKPDLWIAPKSEITPFHIAIRAQSRAAVDAFHRAAIEAGGRDNGAPGLRPMYHPSYYGAFVLDPDGYNLEAVCHAPE